MLRILLFSLIAGYAGACSDEAPESTFPAPTERPQEQKPKHKIPPTPPDKDMTEFLKICNDYQNRPHHEPMIRSMAFEAGFRTEDAIIDQLLEQNPEYQETDQYLGEITDTMCRQIYNFIKQAKVLLVYGVRDIGLLRHANELKKLTILNSKITDSRSLTFIQKLESLNIEDSELNNFSFLNSMVSLKQLRLNSLTVTPDFLTFLPLTASHISLSDVKGLGQTLFPIRRFTSVNLTSTEVGGISAEEEECNLRNVTLRSLGIESLDAMENCSHIYSLDITANNIENLDPISSHQDLITLKISLNPVKDISPLAKNKRLTIFVAIGIDLGDRVEKNSRNCPYGTDVPRAINRFCTS